MFVLPGNSFGSCASVIPRLGYFQGFVLLTGCGRVPFLLPNARRKATKTKFTSRVGYQRKMNGNVNCTLFDG